jgi:hypothetical protein
MSALDRTVSNVTSLRFPSRTSQAVKDALLESEDRLLTQMERSPERSPDRVSRSSRLLDELERAIEDLTDPGLYREMRRLLAELDNECERLRLDCPSVNVHSALGSNPDRAARTRGRLRLTPDDCAAYNAPRHR